MGGRGVLEGELAKASGRPFATKGGASGGWSRGSIFSAAGCVLGELKSCCSKLAAMAPRGAGLLVHRVHCSHLSKRGR